MKTYSLEEAAKMLKVSVASLKEKYEYKQVLPTFLELESVGITNIAMEVGLSKYDGKHYFEHVYIRYFSKSSDIACYINKWAKYGYTASCFINYENISNYTLSEIRGANALKKIFKPTVKNIENLVNNEFKIHELLKAEDEKSTDTVKAFFDKLNGLIELNKDKDGFTASIDETRGYVYTDMFEYSYSVNKDGYINQSIRYRGDSPMDDFFATIK